MAQMTRNIHKIQIIPTDQLDLGCFKETIVVFADKPGVFNGFLGKFFDICLGADDADVVRIAVLALVGQGNVLADEHTDADAGHVEAVKEGLDVVVDLHALALALVFEDTLSWGLLGYVW